MKSSSYSLLFALAACLNACGTAPDVAEAATQTEALAAKRRSACVRRLKDFDAAINSRDIDRFEPLFDAGYESIQPLHPSQNFTGAVPHIRDGWGTIFALVPDFQEDILSCAMGDDGRVWAQLHWFGNVPSNGKVFDLTVAVVFRWNRAGLIDQGVVFEPGDADILAMLQ